MRVWSLYVPNGTALTGADGDTTEAPVVTTEAGRTAIGYRVDVPPGGTSTITLHLTLVPRPRRTSYSFTLVPTPRVRSTAVSVDVTADGRQLRRDPAPLERLSPLSGS
jgi:hypothetical protein